MAFLYSFLSIIIGTVLLQSQQQQQQHEQFLAQFTTKKYATSTTTILLNNTTDADATTTSTATSTSSPPIRIAYVITITSCDSNNLHTILDAAAVLKHSIHLSSIHGTKGGRYDYQMYAIHHPNNGTTTTTTTTQCDVSKRLSNELGYTVLERFTPIDIQDIQGDYLRTHISTNGCCGEKELIKLEAYTLDDHPIVVQLDLDTLILQPLDDLFDAMLLLSTTTTTTREHQRNIASKVPLMWPQQDESLLLSGRVNAMFTRDYNMVEPQRQYKPVQGGFLLLRPNRTVYEEFRSILLKGDYREDSGWGGLVGPYYGGLTFQGIIPYYYDVLHPNQAVELNRCIINNMADNPKDQPTVNDITYGTCRTNQTMCEDCRSRSLSEVWSCHYTLCQKPWNCIAMEEDIIQQRLCRQFHHAWHLTRKDLEQSLWTNVGSSPPATLNNNGTYLPNHFLGHCQNEQVYIPMTIPDSTATGMKK